MPATPAGAQLTIVPLAVAEHDRFFTYLNVHVAENGAGGAALFAPMAATASRLSDERIAAFRNALLQPQEHGGWRRAWIACAADGSIAGHIDLRARPEPGT